jgi:hypothetical protein
VCNISVGTVYYILKEHDVKLRGRTKKEVTKSTKDIKPRDPKYRLEDLKYFYIELDLNADEIAILYNTTRRNIEKILQRRGIRKC